MKRRFVGPLPFLVVIGALGISMLAAACTSNNGHGGGGSTPTPGPTPLVGCNTGASSITMAGEPMGFRRRPPGHAPQAPYIQGKIAVKFTGAGTEPQIGQAMARLHAAQIAPRGDLGYVLFSIPASESPVVAAAALTGIPGIAEAKPLEARYLDVIPDDADFGGAPPYTGPLLTPTQWDMYYIQMPAAWAVTEGLATVRIAIIDTGYDANNVDICQKVVGSAVFDLGHGAQDLTATAQDDDGHGSDVSGIAAASTNNMTRFAGVGWNTELLEVRVFPQPTTANPNTTASNLDIAAAINWAVANRAKVINLSLGAFGQPCDAAEGNAINAAVAANVTVVVAAGNDKSAGGGVASPANCPNAISVGASAINDYSDAGHMASPTEYPAVYSDYGGGLPTLVAPGGDPQAAQLTCTPLVSCDYLQWIINNYSTTACCADSTPPNGPGHGVLIAGTSMAAPHVAGVASLMYAKTPSILPATIKTILSDQALGVDDICSNCPAEGNGRLNALKAITHA